MVDRAGSGLLDHAVSGTEVLLTIAAPLVTSEKDAQPLTADAASRHRGRRLRATPGYDAVGVHPEAFTYASPPRSLAATQDAEEVGSANDNAADIDGGTSRSFADDKLTSRFVLDEPHHTDGPSLADAASAQGSLRSCGGGSVFSVECALEELRQRTRGSPSVHETLVSVSQLQRRGQWLSDPARPYPDPVDPRSDEDFFCDLSAQLVALDSSWRHQPHGARPQSENSPADPHEALLPAQLPVPRHGAPPAASVSSGALFLSASDGELSSTIRIGVHEQAQPEMEVSPHDEPGFWLELTSECIERCRRRGEDVSVSVRDAKGRVAQSRGVALVFGYMLWQRRTERGAAMAAEAFFDAARLLCTVWPGAVARLSPADAAQVMTFALEMGRSKATVRHVAADWLAAAEADAATRRAALEAISRADAHQTDCG